MISLSALASSLINHCVISHVSDPYSKTGWKVEARSSDNGGRGMSGVVRTSASSVPLFHMERICERTAGQGEPVWFSVSVREQQGKGSQFGSAYL